MTKTVVVYHSGYGHTQRVAQFVAEGAKASLVAIDAEAWIASTDGTTARLGHVGIASSTPDRPWIRTVASAMQRKEPNR